MSVEERKALAAGSPKRRGPWIGRPARRARPDAGTAGRARKRPRSRATRRSCSRQRVLRTISGVENPTGSRSSPLQQHRRGSASGSHGGREGYKDVGCHFRACRRSDGAEGFEALAQSQRDFVHENQAIGGYRTSTAERQQRSKFVRTMLYSRLPAPTSRRRRTLQRVGINGASWGGTSTPSSTTRNSWRDYPYRQRRT